MAHAYSVRIWGGQVREMGVLLMLGVPVPFVDARAAAMFASRGRRVAASLAGIIVELLLAAVALWVWLSVDDGWLRSAAFAVMLIGPVVDAAGQRQSADALRRVLRVERRARPAQSGRALRTQLEGARTSDGRR